MGILRIKRVAKDFFQFIDDLGNPISIGGKTEFRIVYSKTEDLTAAGDVYNEEWTQEIIDTFFAQLTEYVALNDGDHPYTLLITDAGKELICTNASAMTITVPPNSSVPFPVGTTIPVFQDGAGTVTFIAGAGVTINSRDAILVIGGQYTGAVLEQTAADVWRLYGV